MRAEDLKRWHWACVGLALGVAFSLVREFRGTDEALAGRSTIDSSEFEQLLTQKTDSGKPAIQDIAVYRLKDGSYWLGAEQLVGRGNSERYIPVRVQTSTPYVPRKGAPAKIAAANYPTVVDYLEAMEAESPDVKYSTRWWDREPMRSALFGIIGVLIVGGVWPSIVVYLVGAGYGKRSNEPEYDLSRFGKGAPEPPAAAKAQPTEEDHEKLRRLEQELERNLAARASGHDVGDRSAPAAAAAPAEPVGAAQPIRKLSGGPVEMVVDDKPKEQKNYAGEFYPTETHVKKKAFTLVELLVVIGIIAILIAMLMPTLTKARRSAQTVECESNMRQVGQALVMYAGENDGQLWPVDVGCLHPRDQRWTAIVFKVWNPPIMKCPADNLAPPPDQWVGAEAYRDGDENGADHSYILNDNVTTHGIRLGSKLPGGISSSEFIIMGEKKTEVDDYYSGIGPVHEGGAVDVLYEGYRHGVPSVGSNYLFFDGHVESKVPRDTRGIDPWSPMPTS